MAALLIGLSVMSVLMGMALPQWSQMVRREKEEELIWRGQQYARAVGLFMRKFANTYPPTVDVLVEQKFLRKKYKDPITNDEFQLIPAGRGVAPGVPGNPATGGQPGSGLGPQSSLGTPTTQTRGPQTPTGGAPGGFGQTGAPNIGISGVVSKSAESSIKIYNGRQKYNEWAFVYIQTAPRVAPGGAARPGMQGPNQPRQPGQPGQAPFGPGQTPFGQPGQTPFGNPGGFGQPGPFGPGDSRRPPVGPTPPNPFGPAQPGGQRPPQ